MWPYLFIIGFVGAGHFFLPYPQEAVFVTVGHLTARYRLMLPLALGLCIVTALASDLLLYALVRGGSRLLIHLTSHVSTDAMEKIKRRLDRRAFLTVFLLRLLPITRMLVTVAAGAVGLPWRTFAAADLLAIGVVAPIFFLLGYHFYATMISFFQATSLTVTLLTIAAVLAVGYGLYLYLEHRHHRAVAVAAIVKKKFIA
jgi:membrane protein DedA with SNARE-associated domain